MTSEIQFRFSADKHKQAIRKTPLLFSLAITVLMSQFTSAPALAVKTQGGEFQVETKVYNLCLEADRLLAEEKYSQAKDSLKTAASYDPTSYSPHVHLAMAKCYRSQKAYDKALVEAQSALRFDPNFDYAVYTSALIYNDMDRQDECLKNLKKFVQITKDTETKKSAQQYIKKIGSFRDLKQATKCVESGKDREALKLLESDTLADPSPYSSIVHSNKSFVLQRLGESERAIEEGKKSLDFDPNNKAIVYNIAIAYQNIAKFDDAITWLKRYAQMETDSTARSAAETFMHELEVDRSQFNAADNKKPDYLDQMKRKREVPAWPEKKIPLRVYIYPGNGVKGFQPVFRSYVIKSLDTWCKSSGKKINYVLAKDPSKADITVAWTKDVLVGSDLTDDRLKAGLTTLNSSEGLIEKATVKIRTVDAFNSDSNVKSGECAFVCMHELGHALGLGHSTYIYDIMYFRSSTKQSGLPTKRDNATIARLYEDHPAVEFIAKAEASEGEPEKYLPPPIFIPPKLTDSKTIVPPLFVPPPLVAEKKLEPPLFTPPPLSNQQKTSPAPSEQKPTSVPSGKSRDILLFVPPPIEKKKNAPKSSPPAPKLFIPPPLKNGQ